MFGSQKAYGGNSNNNNSNNYGNTSYYSSSSQQIATNTNSNNNNNNDSFWGNRSNNSNNNGNSINNNTRLNYSVRGDVSAAAIANDSLYGTSNIVENNNLNNRSNTSRSFQDSTRDNAIKNVEKSYGNLATIVSSSSVPKKTTTWATIASQPAKSQPKSLKAKMAAGLTGTTSKHLPPTVTMDAMSWDSKTNVPPPTPIVHPAPSLSPVLNDDLYGTDDVNESAASVPPNQQTPPSQQSTQPPPVTRENSWSSNGNNNNSSSPVGSITNNSDNLHSRKTNNSTMPPARQNNVMMEHGHQNGGGNYNIHHHQQQQFHHNQYTNNNAAHHQHYNHDHHHNNYRQSNYNKYSNQVSSRNNNNNLNNNDSADNQQASSGVVATAPAIPSSTQPSEQPRTIINYANANNKHLLHQLPPAHRDLIEDDDDDDDDNDDDDEQPQPETEDLSHLLLEKLIIENNYNPKEFDLNLRNARFFIIKSYSEDDIHRSIKYSIWCSTEHGNKRLDNAFRQQEDKGPIYLFFSVNRSGHFCGVAQMMSYVDYNASSGVWSQDKWKGQFKVKWIYVKDVPNEELRHITLENNENKPVTNSRDTQEVPYEKGKLVINIIHRLKHQTSIFDDFQHYEKKQEELHRSKMENAAMMGTSPPPQQMAGGSGHHGPHHHNNYYNNSKMQSNNSQSHQYHHHHGGTMPPLRDGPGGLGPGGAPMYRGSNNYNNKPRSYNNNLNNNNDRDAGSMMMDRGGSGHYSRNDYSSSSLSSHQPPLPLPQSRNNFRNNNYGDGRNHRNDYHHRSGGDYGNRSGGDYYQRDSGGYNRSDYYSGQLQQRDYQPPPPQSSVHNDYSGRGGGEYGHSRGGGHDRMQSWRS